MHILAFSEFTEAQIARLHRLAGRDQLYTDYTEQTDAPVDERARACEVAFGNLPQHWLGELSALRWLQLESIDVGEYAGLPWDELGGRITVTNIAGLFSQPVAETALAGIIARYRGIDELVRHQSARRWQKMRVRPELRLLSHACVVFAGYGSIARALERLFEPFGCDIRRFARTSADAQIHSREHLDEALAEADIVVAALPATAQTENLFDARRLDRIKHGALFVNVGRGSVVDETALVQRLQSGQIGGAVLDVTVDEPLPDEHALWTCPNTILTQHTAGGTPDEIDRKITFFEENLKKYRESIPLRNVVQW